MSYLFINIYSIIRCPDLSLARSCFNDDKYQWIEEKHGSGPKHFHTTLGPHHVEMYPLRKGQLSKEMELQFYIEIVSKDVIDKHVQDNNRTLWTLKDPEDRTVVAALKQMQY